MVPLKNVANEIKMDASHEWTTQLYTICNSPYLHFIFSKQCLWIGIMF